jgi:LysR family transcriptional regulator, glycine cleavage system transcriptional activator
VRQLRARNNVRPETFRRLPLGSLRVFVAVAEHLSFTRAASALGVTVSAASMQVQSLEDYLGVSLFRRQGRYVQLSAEAVQLLPRLRDGLHELQSALDEARIARGTGALRISTLHSFLLQWLLPRIPNFEAQHPQIGLMVETSNLAVNFAETGVHAAVRFGGGDWTGLHSEKILDEWLVPVCSPTLLQKLGPVHHPDDLPRYRLLHSSTEPWSAWLTGTPNDSWPETGIGFDDSAAIVRSAEAGAGLALARWSLVASEVQAGRLAIASPHVTPYARRYYFVCPPRTLEMKKVAAFRDWLRGQAAEHPPPQ